MSISSSPSSSQSSSKDQQQGQTPSTAVPGSTQTGATPVVQQPYGNQAMLEDLGLAAIAETSDPDLQYAQLRMAGAVDFPAVLGMCLSNRLHPAYARWLSRYTFDDIRSEVPSMVDSARDAIWPANQRLTAAGGMTVALGAGGDISGKVSTERDDDGVAVEMEGQALFTAGVDLPGLAALEASTSLGLDLNGVSLQIGAGLGAGGGVGFKARAGWRLPTEALDGTLGGLSCDAGLDSVVRSIDMLIEALTMPSSLELHEETNLDAKAAFGVGLGVSASAVTNQRAGFGYDENCTYSHASIGAGGAFGLDLGILKLLGQPGVLKDAANYNGTVELRFELPNGSVDSGDGRLFACWTTESREAASSTWVEVGGLTDGVSFLTALFTGKDRGGTIALGDLPDRALVRTLELPIKNEETRTAFITAAGMTEDAGPASVIAKGGLRVETPAVWVALGSSETLDTHGDSTEGALLDAERQIAAHFLGETYRWPGASQLDHDLDDAVAACVVSNSQVEVSTSHRLELGYNGAVREQPQTAALAASAREVTTVTAIVAVDPTDLHRFLGA